MTNRFCFLKLRQLPSTRHTPGVTSCQPGLQESLVYAALSPTPQVAKLRRSLAEEYLRYLTERDARKILIGDLNELRYQQEDMSLAQTPGNPS